MVEYDVTLKGEWHFPLFEAETRQEAIDRCFEYLRWIDEDKFFNIRETVTYPNE